MTMTPDIQGRRIGYIRINTLCVDLQDQLEGVALDHVFSDTIVRKDQLLAGFVSMLNFVREGDTLLVQRLDRLARNANEFLDIVYSLTKRGVRIECVTEKLIFPAGEESPVRNLLLLSMGAFLEAMRSWVSERQRQGRGVVAAQRDDQGT